MTTENGIEKGLVSCNRIFGFASKSNSVFFKIKLFFFKILLDNCKKDTYCSRAALFHIPVFFVPLRLF